MTHADRLHALALANEVRLGKASVKRAVREGRLTLDELLADPPRCCQKVPTFEVLQWLSGVGRVRARKFASGVVSETLPLCALGDATRRRLLERVNNGTGVPA